MKRGYRILLSLSAGAPASLIEEALESLWPGMADELVGLFIEDSELLALARLPVAREIRHDATGPRPPDAVTLEREFRAQAERMRQVFERSARRLARHCAFRVARSSPADLIREAGREFDVLLLADSPQRLEYHWLVRRQLQLVFREGPRMVVIARPARRLARRIALLWDGRSEARSAAATAADIADRRSMELLLLLPPGGVELADAELLLREAEAAALPCRVRRLPEFSPAIIAAALQAEGVASLVIPRSAVAEQPEFVAEVIERAPCSVILAD